MDRRPPWDLLGSENILEVFWSESLRRVFHEQKPSSRSSIDRSDLKSLLETEDLLEVFYGQSSTKGCLWTKDLLEVFYGQKTF